MPNRLAVLIEQIRERPGMYLGHKCIFRLRAFLDGYVHALREIDGAEKELRLLRKILSIVEKKYRFKISQGWDSILWFVSGTECAAYDAFEKIWVEQILPKVDQLDKEGEEKLRTQSSPPS
jgi:hypothetical protein